MIKKSMENLSYSQKQEKFLQEQKERIIQFQKLTGDYPSVS